MLSRLLLSLCIHCSKKCVEFYGSYDNLIYMCIYLMNVVYYRITYLAIIVDATSINTPDEAVRYCETRRVKSALVNYGTSVLDFSHNKRVSFF